MKAAEKITKMMKENLSQLDPWIENELTYKFLESNCYKVRVIGNDPKLLSYGVSGEGIIAKLNSEGFIVKHDYEDSPYAVPYYEISIPEQYK